jgi:hypothetical protein
MGEIGLLIFGAVITAFAFIKFGLPQILEYKGKALAVAASQNCGMDLRQEHEAQFNGIKEILLEESEKRRKRHLELDKAVKGLEENIVALFSAVEGHSASITKISAETLENQLYSDFLRPFLRLKAFRRLLAMRKNGRVWEKGLALVLENKNSWRDVMDTELNIEIVDVDYYGQKINEINQRIFDVA